MTDETPTRATYPKGRTITADLAYAISVLLAAGAVVEHRSVTVTANMAGTQARHAQRCDWIDEPYWSILAKGRPAPVVVTGRAMLELAYTEARRRRDDWQTKMDTVHQVALFAAEDTPRYEVI